MITDPAQRVALSNLGWVDHGFVWRFDARTDQVDRIQLGAANHLVLSTWSQDEFAAVHHFDGSRVEITTHPFSDPAEVRRKVEVTGWAPRVAEDFDAWPLTPSIFVAWLNNDATAATGYYLISASRRDATIERLDWFSSDSCDLGYQSVIAVSAVPDTDELVFGVQRSSHLVVVSPSADIPVRLVNLADGSGNAVPHLRTTAPEVWAVDYDTLVRVDRRTWEVTGVLHLQEAATGTRMFVGDLWMPPDESFVLVPRPGMGDVMTVDPVRLIPIGGASLEKQPLVGVVLRDRRVVARDWKTGDLLLGDLA